MAAIVFDLGGTYLRCGVLDHLGELQHLRKHRIESFLHGHRPEVVWEKVISLLINYTKEVERNFPPDAPIVLSFPGPIAKPSKILSAPTLVGETSFLPDLATTLAKHTGRNINIINDVSAAAWYISHVTDANRFLVVTISSGIGSKIFDRNHSAGVLDDIPYAGEIGHVKIDNIHNGLMCDCGGKGHLGAISSGRGIERFARYKAHEQPEIFFKSTCYSKFGGEINNLTNEHHIVPAALIGDKWALQIIRECTHPLAKIMLQLIMAIGLEKIVIIGGFALSLGKVYLEILRSLLVESCDYSVIVDKIDDMIFLGSIKEEACLEGAAIYARKCLQC